VAGDNTIRTSADWYLKLLICKILLTVDADIENLSLHREVEVGFGGKTQEFFTSHEHWSSEVFLFASSFILLH